MSIILSSRDIVNTVKSAEEIKLLREQRKRGEEPNKKLTVREVAETIYNMSRSLDDKSKSILADYRKLATFHRRICLRQTLHPEDQHYRERIFECNEFLENVETEIWRIGNEENAALRNKLVVSNPLIKYL